MTDNEMRKAILKALYEERRRWPGVGALSVNELVNICGADKEIVYYNLDYLTDRGFIQSSSLSEKEITVLGIDFFEGPSEFNPPQDYVNQKIEISGGHVGQVNQAHTITNPSLFLSRLVEAIENHPDIDREKKKRWTETLWEMSKHPALVELLRILIPTVLVQAALK